MSTYNEFTRGSEWRKWDLHFHTPSSYDYENGAVTDDEIIGCLIKNDISVVCITDHNYIDTDRIKKLQEKGKDKIVVLPGIEFCSELGGSEAIHFIGIFSEKSDFESIWTKIQGKLEITPVDITRRGGKENIQSDLIDTCDIIHELGGITSIHAGTKTNTIENIKNNLLIKMEQKRRILSECIDILELGKLDDVDDYNSIVFKSIKFRLPMIICSDNHNIRNYSIKCNCWIKADVSLEGLKQITYEPESRVKIQESNPNIKKLYNIIEKVKFIDRSSKSKFSNYEIGFNPDLNAIIGGKSSGKSLLLHSIAKAVGNDTDIKNYVKILENVDLEVYYSDEPDKKRTPEDKRIIEFLPQQYIEQIVRGKADTTKGVNIQNYFDKFIEDLIRQDDEIERLYENHHAIVSEAQSKLDDSINTWILQDRALSEAKQELRPLGDKKAISKEIERLQKTFEDLTKKAGLTTEEFALFNKLSETNNNCNNRIEYFMQIKVQIENLRNYLNDNFLNDIIRGISFVSNDNYVNNLFGVFKSNVQNTIILEKSNFETILTEKIEQTSRIINTLQNRISRNDEKLSPILTKNQIQNEIKIIEKNISLEKEKIVLIENKEKEIAAIKKARDQVVFIDYYKKICDSYNRLADAINDKIGEKWIEGQTNLTLSATRIFEPGKFVESISSAIDTRKYLEHQFSGCGFSASVYQFTDNHIDNISEILKLSLQDEERFANFKKSDSTEGLLRAVLIDCNYIDFDIKKGDDTLQNMSEGKMGIVILQLYLSLSRADFPILIDQPEDNLDNRTVYAELNDYIKQCKQRRQIIMVSHNANLVVNTDAENVIIANQAGEDGKENKEYRFEYVNGALENTFDEPKEIGILYQKGVREHVCEILEGGTDAFKKREKKYNLK
jgi:energy-coupling factor transporter ATP-binding protein EcfA2